MLTRRLWLLVAVIPFLSTHALASSINIFCYYLDGSKESSFMLLDASSKPVQIQATFSSDSNAFVVDQDDLIQIDLDCRRITAEKGFNYDHVEGATILSGWLHQSYLGFMSKHYRLLRAKSIPVEMEAASQVFTSLADMHFSEHPIADDATQLLTKFKSSVLDGITSKTPLAPFIEPVFSKDFNRSNFVVLLHGKVLYGHKENLIWDIGQNKFSVPSLDQDQMLEQLYAAIEGNVDPALVKDIGELELRKHIALALATRTQAFESVPITKVHAALMEKAALHSIFLNVSGMGRIDNVITVEGTKLVVESNSGIRVQLIQDGAWDVGLYLCHRELRMDLRTGLMTPEDVTLTQFVML